MRANVDTDERPFVLVWELTRACELTCKHCRADAQPERHPSALGRKCGACEYRGVCGGSRSRAYATTGDPLASDPLCAYVPKGYDGPLPGDRSAATGD